MLISSRDVVNTLKQYGISIRGILHVGAHDCQELTEYTNVYKIPATNIVWIDAIQEKVSLAFSRGIPNVYFAVVSDKDNEQITFNISSNNGLSSSILELGTHKTHYPSIHYTTKRVLSTTTLDTFFKTRSLSPSTYDFWNFDIQGAELMALHGATQSLKHVKAVYLEVSTEDLYKNYGKLNDVDAFLEKEGFQRVILEMTNSGWGEALYVRIPK